MCIRDSASAVALVSIFTFTTFLPACTLTTLSAIPTKVNDTKSPGVTRKLYPVSYTHLCPSKYLNQGFVVVSVETGRKTISLHAYFLPKASNAGDF